MSLFHLKKFLYVSEWLSNDNVRPSPKARYIAPYYCNKRIKWLNSKTRAAKKIDTEYCVCCGKFIAEDIPNSTQDSMFNDIIRDSYGYDDAAKPMNLCINCALDLFELRTRMHE